MSLDITIQLDDADLEHFIDAMRRAQDKASDLSPQAIVDAASKLLVDVPKTQHSAFHQGSSRKPRPDDPARPRSRVWPARRRPQSRALLPRLLCDPNDIIPDSVPVIGFLDDAIMIELCVRELRPELDSYSDFVLYRNQEATRRGVDPASLKTERVDWLETRRLEAHEGMRRRRRDGYGGGNNWAPTLFRAR